MQHRVHRINGGLDGAFRTGERHMADKTALEGHRPGSRKSEVHKVFLEEGKEMAHAFGLKKKLKESSLRSWFSTWNTAGDKPKKVAKKAAAPVAAKKPEPAKKPAVAKKAEKSEKSEKVVSINSGKKPKKAAVAAA